MPVEMVRLPAVGCVGGERERVWNWKRWMRRKMKEGGPCSLLFGVGQLGSLLLVFLENDRDDMF